MKTYTVKRKIMWGDLDSLGIVFYPRYYEWIDASGHLFFESLGLILNRLWKERGILFGLVETSCRYSKPGRYHQEIEITTQIERLRSKTVLLKHTILDSHDRSRLVKGYEKRICMDASDYANLTSITIPPDIYEILEKALGNP